MTETNTILSTAREAIGRGYVPLPIRPDSKAPSIPDWRNVTYSGDELEAAFGQEGAGVGLLLGRRSKGLVDVDLDVEEARVLAAGFMPVTGMRHGRGNQQVSHYWYEVADELDHPRQTFADPVDGTVLLEIRGEGGQSLIPPSVHPSGDDYWWAEDNWGTPTRLPWRNLVLVVREMAAITLLSRHWPDGSRHDAALALAGGLARLIGRHPRFEDAEDVGAFVHNVAALGRDEEVDDRVRAAHDTVTKFLKGHKKLAGWRTLSSLIPKDIAYRAAHWLYVDSIDPDDESIEVDTDTTDLDDEEEDGLRPYVVRPILTENPEPPPMLVRDVIYAGELTWWQGHPGSAKTLLMLHFVHQLVSNDQRVMFVDGDSGREVIGERLALMGAEQEQVDHNLCYLEFPPLNIHRSEILDSFGRILEEHQPELVVLDACADLLGASGLKENSNDDINLWHANLISPLLRAGLTVVVVDHLAKGGEGQTSGWGRGGGAKQAKAAAAWSVTTNNKVEPGGIGYVTIHREKARRGHLPPHLTFTVDAREQEPGGLKIARNTAKANLPTTDTLARNVLGWLVEQHEPMQTQAVVDRVNGRAVEIRSALDRLEDMGLVEQSKGAGRSLLWKAADKAFEVGLSL